MQLYERRRWTEGALFFVGYVACVPAANWLIERVGVACMPNDPCIIPVAPHIDAPSGVLMIGLALVLRDLVQRRLGLWWGVGAIAIGTVLSATFAPASLVIASASAFLLSELADLAVYTPLQKRGLVRAVLLSSMVGLVVDSVIFLWLAFGSLNFLAGQIIGKMWMVLFAMPIVAWLRNRDRRASMSI
jgi:queuosine precursor transporter